MDIRFPCAPKPKLALIRLVIVTQLIYLVLSIFWVSHWTKRFLQYYFCPHLLYCVFVSFFFVSAAQNAIPHCVTWDGLYWENSKELRDSIMSTLWGPTSSRIKLQRVLAKNPVSTYWLKFFVFRWSHTLEYYEWNKNL